MFKIYLWVGFVKSVGFKKLRHFSENMKTAFGKILDVVNN